MTTPDREDARREMGDALPAIVYSASPDLHLTYANRYAMEFFGITRDFLVSHEWLELVHPDDRDAVRTAWAASIETGQHYKHEHRLRMADGEYRKFHAEALPLRDADGSVIKWYGVLTPLEGPRRRGPPPGHAHARAARLDYYPLRDEATGELRLIAVAACARAAARPRRQAPPPRLLVPRLLRRGARVIGGMTMLDATDPIECNRYRIAFGQAARLLEASKYDHSYGRDFARRIEPDRTRTEVARLCGHRVPAELVDLAVDDVMAGRRPRW